MMVKLTVGERTILNDLAKRNRGRGGFQNLLIHLWYRFDEDTGELEIPYLLLERIQNDLVVRARLVP
jgi:hypothetical protein